MANNNPQNLYGFPQPLTQVFPSPIKSARAPTTADFLFPIGQVWIDTVGDDAYILVDVTANVATWNVMATTPGNVDTLTASSGGAITPSAGNINLLGTANQITTAGAGSTITFTLPAAITAPGSLTTTTTLTSGTSLAVTTSATVGTTLGVTGLTTLAAHTAVGTANINASGAAATTIGTGGTGTVAIGNTTGNTAVTGTLTVSSTITATNGNLVLGTSGNKILSTSVGTTTAAGANSFGSVTLVGGTATVSTTSVNAASLIVVWRQTVGATGAAALGQLCHGTIVAATSFVINSNLTADATALAATDVSVVGWMIIN